MKPVFIRDSSCAIADQTGCLEWNVDSTYIDYTITGRMLITDTTQGEFGPIIDTVNQFVVNLFEDRPNVLACSAVPEFLLLDTLPPGNDTIFYVKMAVKPTMPHNQLSEFIFFESDIFVVNDTVFPPDTTFFNGCNTSQMVTAWRVNPDSTVNYQVYPNTDLGYRFWFQADTAYVPVNPAPSVTFAANPSSISVGASTSLGWVSSYADSVVIRNYLGQRMTAASNGATAGSISWTATSSGTFTFSATAYGTESRTDVKFATVTVGGGGGTGPTVTVSGLAGEYNQGELVEFVVTATNTTGGQISIQASQMPAGATFGVGNQVIGVSPLSGTFAWTPNVNQSGSFTIRFAAADAGGTTDRYVTVQVNELLFDRLFSTSRAGNRPVGGLPGRREIQFPIDLISHQTVYGIQFDMRYPDDLLRVDSILTTVRIPDYVVYENIGVTPGDIRVVTFGLNNEPVEDTNTTAILYAYMTIDSSAVPWTDCVIYLEDGRESINPDPMVGSLPLVTDSGLVAVDSLGDVNLDKIIDVADAVNIVAYIIQTFTLTLRQFEVADVITDSAVNVFDLVADVNQIFGTPLPAPAPPAPGDTAVLALDYADLPVGASEMLVVRSEIPQEVAGVQLELSYDPAAVSLGTPQLTSDNENYAIHSNDIGSGRLRVLLYRFAPHDAGDFMQPGEVSLVQIPLTARENLASGDKTKIRLTEALLSTTMAGAINVQGVDVPLPKTFALHQNYPNPFNPITNIRFEIGVGESGGSQDVQLDVYNVLGQHVTTLVDGLYPPGEYEVIWDATDQRGQRVATGIYLYRLKVGDERTTRKMLFLK